MDGYIDISYPIAVRERKGEGCRIRLIDFEKYFIERSREKALTKLYIFLLNEINAFRDETGSDCEEFLKQHPATDIEKEKVELFEDELLVTVETGYSNSSRKLDEFEQFYIDRYFDRLKEDAEWETLTEEEKIAKMVEEIDHAEKTAKELGMKIIYLKKK